jgi:5-methyltetrahydrofolate--homocysteine methyltransferase
METAVTSPGRTVRIGPQHPFVIIGERINPTGRKSLAAEMAAGNFERVRADALAQVAAGAQMLDVNAGIPLADEPAILAETIRVVQSVTDVPLSIDSSIVAALEQGLAAYRELCNGRGRTAASSLAADRQVWRGRGGCRQR